MYNISRSALFLSLIAATIALSNCSKTCSQPMQSSAAIKNTTGRALTLEVCVESILKPQQLQIPADQNGNMVVENHSSKVTITGNQKSQCMAMQMTTPVYLTGDSFGTVKFCHNNTYQNAPMQIVEKTQNCPAGTIEQTAPPENCAL